MNVELIGQFKWVRKGESGNLIDFKIYKVGNKIVCLSTYCAIEDASIFLKNYEGRLIDSENVTKHYFRVGKLSEGVIQQIKDYALIQAL